MHSFAVNKVTQWWFPSSQNSSVTTIKYVSHNNRNKVQEQQTSHCESHQKVIQPAVEAVNDTPMGVFLMITSTKLPWPSVHDYCVITKHFSLCFDKEELESIHRWRVVRRGRREGGGWNKSEYPDNL